MHESVRRLIDRMVSDLLAETRERIAAAAPRSAGDIRALGKPAASFSSGMRAHLRDLKAFLFKRMYRHIRVNRMTNRARRVVGDLFAVYLEDPGALPEEWRAQAAALDVVARARLVADYIAGMTDRFALTEHNRLFDATVPS